MMNKKVSISIENITITGWLFLPDRGKPYPMVCICHGIPAGNAPDPDDGGYPLLAERMCRHGLAVIIFNFRGTGTSGGNIDLLGWTRDLTAVVDYVSGFSEVDSSDLALLGFSGGAAVSIYVAARDPRISSVTACACPSDFGLIANSIESASYVNRFRKIGAIRDKNFPNSITEWLDGFRKIRPIDCVDQIAPRPLLLIHSIEDETVSVSHAYRLYEKAKQPKELIILDGAGHKLRHDNRVIDAFLERLRTWSGITNS